MLRSQTFILVARFAISLTTNYNTAFLLLGQQPITA